MQTDSECYCVRFNSDGKYLLSGHQNRQIYLWNTETKNKVATFEGAHNQEVFDICIFQNNEKFISCGRDKIFYLWETLKGTWSRKFEGHYKQINSVCLNPTFENVIASGSLDGNVCLWDLVSKNQRPI